MKSSFAKPSTMNSSSRSAYTLVELLIFLAIAVVVAAAFVGILVIIVQIQARQSSSGSVQQESATLLQEIQYYVQNAALVNIPIDTPTSTLSLRMGASSVDPVTFTLATGTVYLQVGTGTAQALTSSHIVISGLTFTRHANPPAHDSVSVTFTASANTQNIEQLFTQAFRTTITQVSAASFDSSVVPSSTNVYSLGAPGAVWNNINGVIYFNGSNVGIGTASPLAPLEVYGGDLFVYKPGGGVGLVLGDPSGGCWRLTVNASGTLGTASVSCSTP